MGSSVPAAWMNTARSPSKPANSREKDEPTIPHSDGVARSALGCSAPAAGRRLMPMTRVPGHGTVRISACPIPPDAPEIHTIASPTLFLAFPFALRFDHRYPAGQEQGDQRCDQHRRKKAEPGH